MEEIKTFLQGIPEEELLEIILSASRDREKIIKIKVRPVKLNQGLIFQCTKYIGKQVMHENLGKEEMISLVIREMETNFRQIEIHAKNQDATGLVSKKGKVTFKTKNIKNPRIADKYVLEHNRQKKYLLPENEKVPFLIDLGVMTAEGKIVHSRYDKYRQINRFLEFIRDIVPKLPKDRECTIIDFGCGKSYLTFAMYYYLREKMKLDIRIIGLDLKKEVIENCSELAKKYGYHKLEFLYGDIETFEGVEHVDMVVTLHACDTATDYALAKAVKWGASVILSVPCCQHELNKTMKNESLQTVFQYGLLKERTAALFTDAIRAEILNCSGYETQVLEFIDMEHTPKNILLRAVFTGEKKSKKNLDEFLNMLQITPTLCKLLLEKQDI